MQKLRTNIRIAELDDFSDVVVRIFKKANGLQGDENLKAIVGKVESLSASLTSALKRGKAVSNLDERDAARDEALRRFAVLAEGYTEIPIDNKNKAAREVFAVFSRYGREIARKNLKEESALIESLLEDLAKMSEKTALLEGLDILIDRLRAAQDEFSAAYDEFLSAKADEKGESSASDIKKPLLSLINDDFLSFLETMRKINAEKYGAFCSQIESEVERTNALVKNRRGSAEKSGEKKG